MNSYPVICRNCERSHDRKSWQKLPLLGVHLDCLEARECPCGDTLAIEVDGYGGANDHAGATRNMDALGA